MFSACSSCRSSAAAMRIASNVCAARPDVMGGNRYSKFVYVASKVSQPSAESAAVCEALHGRSSGCAPPAPLLQGRLGGCTPPPPAMRGCFGGFAQQVAQGPFGRAIMQRAVILFPALSFALPHVRPPFPQSAATRKAGRHKRWSLIMLAALPCARPHGRPPFPHSAATRQAGRHGKRSAILLPDLSCNCLTGDHPSLIQRRLAQSGPPPGAAAVPSSRPALISSTAALTVSTMLHNSASSPLAAAHSTSPRRRQRAGTPAVAPSPP